MPLAELTHVKRKAVKDAQELVGGSRFIDMGVKIHVVRQELEAGTEVIPGMAKVASLGTHDLGGLYDSTTGQFVGPSRNPRIWYCNESSLDVVLHRQPERGALCFGAMGSGKTQLLAQWLIARAIEYTDYAPLEGGVTAPTDSRLEEVLIALRKHMRDDWYVYNAHTKLFLLRNQIRLRCIGTARRSASQGSRVQGWNWGFHGGDEIQDQSDENANIDARGRRAPHGHYRRISTCTAKDSPEWRQLRMQLLASGQWQEHKFQGSSNPFVKPKFWEDMRASMSDREYRQIVLAEMLGPERATYPSWDRLENVRPLPMVGGKDITYDTIGAHALLGHDPGSTVDVTEMLKLYRFGRAQTHWYVVDEWTTRDDTNQSHVYAVRRALQEKWGLNYNEPDEPQVIVRIDPMGDSDQRTPQSVYTTWKQAGFKAKAAAYNKKGEGRGWLHKDQGIEMVNRLLKAANGQRRLFIACDERRVPAAPKLADALEMSERDDRGQAERAKKGSRQDLSHWCCALRYALHPYERLRDGRGIRSTELAL